MKRLCNDTEIHFNRKDSINSELDIYIPSLKLAFELNGLFHYEPVFGNEKLEKIKTNDMKKVDACVKNHIDLHIIDSSSLKKFNKKKYDGFLNKILSIIEQKKNP